MSVVTQTEAAKMLGMTDGGIKYWVAHGIIPARRVGRIVLIELKDLEEANRKSLLNPQRQRAINKAS